MTSSEAGTDMTHSTEAYDWFNAPNVLIKPNTNRNWTGDSWILLNTKATGYYRINYSAENWKQITAALSTENAGNIHSTNRAQLIDDAFDFAKSKMIKLEIPLNLLTYMSVYHEVDYLVLLTAYQYLESYDELLIGTEFYHKYLVIKRNLSKLIIPFLILYFNRDTFNKSQIYHTKIILKTKFQKTNFTLIILNQT